MTQDNKQPISRFFTIAIGDESIEVRQLPSRLNERWRQAFVDGILAKIVLQVREVKDFDLEAVSLDSILELFDRIRPTLLSIMSEIIEEIIRYSPVLQARADWARDNIFDDQAIDGLQEVLKRAFPLDDLQRIFSGLQGLSTSPSLPSPSGASRMTTPISTSSSLNDSTAGENVSGGKLSFLGQPSRDISPESLVGTASPRSDQIRVDRPEELHLLK